MDALQALLGAKPVSEITEDVKIKRLGANFTIKAITVAEMEAIKLQATRPVKRGNKVEHEVDEKVIANLLIAKATVSPDFTNAELLKHYGAIDAGECVEKALLPGEISTIQNVILTLAGFGDFDEEVQDAKN